MNKFLLFFLILSFSLLIKSQGPPPPGNIPDTAPQPTLNQDTKTPPPMGSPSTEGVTEGESTEASIVQVQALTIAPPQDWDCTIEFYSRANVYYTERFDSSSLEAFRGSFTKRVDNSIDEIYWSGSRCYCWVILYQSKYYQGLNLGFWTFSESGSYDLSEYITYDFSDGGWERWSTTASSYSIYCY